MQAVAKEFGLGGEESEEEDDDDEPRVAGTSQQEVVAQAISKAATTAASMVDNSGVDPVRELLGGKTRHCMCKQGQGGGGISCTVFAYAVMECHTIFMDSLSALCCCLYSLLELIDF